MANFILNPEAKEIELTFTVSMQKLETLGWDFEYSHERVSEVQGIEIDRARNYNYNNYEIRLWLESNENGGIDTFYGFENYNNNETSGKEQTGDDDKTLEDIVELLEESSLIIDDAGDYTTDENNAYVSTFIQK